MLARSILPNPLAADPAGGLLRRHWVIQGQVQGVGFRPLVYRQACAAAVTGFVGNAGADLIIEAQGMAEQLDAFGRQLETLQPPLARVDRITSQTLPVVPHEVGFHILPSTRVLTPLPNIAPDAALCSECRDELLAGPGRHRLAGYGLINCTNCGPRFSIIRHTPYDRAATTMAGFPMCPACRGEYEDPGHRRFHAQPTACPICGPRLALLDATGLACAGDPIGEARECLMAGLIVAIKGIGGFHLAVRAVDHGAVERLRRLKQRDSKPFAIMCGSLEQACEWVRLSAQGLSNLHGPAAPIVLAPRRTPAKEPLSPLIAPGHHRLGVMLPYTPIQHLLFDGAGGELGPLVMTSANVSHEPLVIDNGEAIERLAGLCDRLLVHDRPIQRPLDDSVVIDMPGRRPLPVRRARGYVPTAIPLPGALKNAPPGLCMGADLKGAVAVVTQGQVILSHHLGDLTHPLAFGHFRQTVRDLLELFCVTPEWIAHDLHPLYLSTQYAGELGRLWNVPLIGVQHHHAHAAGLLAEHGRVGPAMAIVCDGTGYGTDQNIWGGEVLAVRGHEFERVAHLRPLALAGGDAASIDCRRAALGAIVGAFGAEAGELAVTRRLFPDAGERSFLLASLRSGLAVVSSGSAGRMFDAVAAILGVCEHNDYEGQAAALLESAAFGCTSCVPVTEGLFGISGAMEIDLSALIRRIVGLHDSGCDAGSLAALFHDQLAEALCHAAVAATGGVQTVGLSGGVFCNERLTGTVMGLLEARGLTVLRHELAPPNDGGIALGQAAIAASALQASSLARGVTP